MANIENLFNSNGELIYPLTHPMAVIDNNGKNLEQVLEVLDNKVDWFELVGEGINRVKAVRNNLIAGRNYSLIPKNGKWPTPETNDSIIYVHYHNKQGEDVMLFKANKNEERSRYDFKAPEDFDGSLIFEIRASEGQVVNFVIYDNEAAAVERFKSSFQIYGDEFVVEKDGTDVYLTNKGYVYIRGVARKNYTIDDIGSELSVDLIENESNKYLKIKDGDALCFSSNTQTFNLKSRSSVTEYDIVILANAGGDIVCVNDYINSQIKEKEYANSFKGKADEGYSNIVKLIGNDDTFVSFKYYGCIPDRIYRLKPKNSLWDRSNVTSKHYQLQVGYYVDEKFQTLAQEYGLESVIKDTYIFRMGKPDNDKDYLYIGVRANKNEVVEFVIDDITDMVYGIYTSSAKLEGRVFNAHLGTDDKIIYDKNTYITPYLELKGSTLRWNGTVNNLYLLLYDENKKKVNWYQSNADGRTITLKEDHKYVRCSFNYDGYGSVVCDSDVLWFNVNGINRSSLATIADFDNIPSNIFTLNPDFEFNVKFQNAVKTSGSVEPVVIARFSDLHASSENLGRFISFTEKYDIDSCLNCGDFNLNDFSNDISWYYNTQGVEKIMITIGNHELTESGSNYPTHGGIDAYQKYLEPVVNNWGVMQPNNAAEEGQCYYYKDFDGKQVRLIVLDIQMFDSVESKWLETVLQDSLSKGLHVVIASHFTARSYTGFDCNYCSKRSSTAETSIDRDGMFCVHPEIATTAADTVQSFIEEGGVFVGWLVGHLHYEIVGRINDYPNQLVVAVENAGLKSNSEANHIQGTKSQDAFDVICIDTNEKLLKVFKVGNNRDKYMRKKDSICLSYNTGEIVAEA